MIIIACVSVAENLSNELKLDKNKSITMIQRNHRPAVITIHKHGQNQASENEKKCQNFRETCLKIKFQKYIF